MVQLSLGFKVSLGGEVLHKSWQEGPEGGALSELLG